jgi:hypothetical protein
MLLELKIPFKSINLNEKKNEIQNCRASRLYTIPITAQVILRMNTLSP